MRNLLSFVCGLLVSLLYGLVRAILLLDRLICAIYDLPLWSRLAGAAEQIGRRRGLCALAVFVPLLFVPGALLTRAGTLVLADGRPLGLIEDAAALPAAVTALEQSASALAGADYTLPVSIKTRPLRAASSMFLTEEELQAGLIEASGELDTLAVISVDGKQAGVCRSAEDAQTVLDRVMAQHTTAADKNAAFVQDVRVDTVVAQAALAQDSGAPLAQLSARLDGSAARAVT